MLPSTMPEPAVETAAESAVESISGTESVSAPCPEAEFAPGFDATPLRIRHWPAANPWGVVLLVHGIGEHGGRYERTGRLLAAAGLDTHAFDLRGHGRSGGRRVSVERWDDFLEDVRVRLAAVRRPGVPTILFGHSMGALISLTYVCSGRPAPDLLVLSAPPLDAAVPGWQRALAPALSRVLPGLVLANPISGDQLSHDPAVGAAYFADELVQPRTTTRLGAELFGAMKRARGGLSGLATAGVPTLVIHGGADTLVPTRFSEPLAAVPGVERRVLPELRHETLNEPEGPQVVEGVVAWIRQQVHER